MARSTSDLLKEAGEIARRSDLQLIVLLTTLVITGLSIGQAYWFPPPQPAVASTTQVVGAKSAPVEPGRATGQNSSCSSDQTNQTIARCMGVFFKQLGGIDFEVLRTKAPGHEQLLPAEAQARAKVRRETTLKQVNTRALGSFIAERTSLDLPGGIKLPVPRTFAPLAWLVLAGFALVFLIERRQMFWSIWRAALHQRPTANLRPIQVQAHDLPVWLAPAALGAPDDARRKLEHAAGLSQDPQWRAALMFLVLLCFAGGIVAITFVGANLGYFTAVTSGHPSTALIAWITLYVTLFAAGVDLVLLALAAGVRWSARLAKPALLDKGRRGFLLACVAGGVLTAAAGVFAYPVKQLLVQPRFRKRVSRFAHVGLAQGFYRNVSSNHLHYVGINGVVALVDPELKARNLRPLGPDEDGRILRLPEAERVALDLWTEGRPEDAISLILATVRDRFPGRQVVRPYYRLLDLAAGMALHSQRPEKIDAVAEALGQVVRASPHGTVDLSDRVARWTTAVGEKWRSKRWNPGRPLRWDNREHPISG